MMIINIRSWQCSLAFLRVGGTIQIPDINDHAMLLSMTSSRQAMTIVKCWLFSYAGPFIWSQ